MMRILSQTFYPVTIIRNNNLALLDSIRINNHWKLNSYWNRIGLRITEWVQYNKENKMEIPTEEIIEQLEILLPHHRQDAIQLI